MAAPRSEKLVDDETREMLRKRGTELLGVALFALGVAFVAVLATYSPDDPSPFNATGEAPHNMLGSLGANIAGALVFALGWAAWGIPAMLVTWGARLVIHRGEERVLTRCVIGLIAILAGSAFLAAHVPLESWEHRFGLGGRIGDSLLLNVLALVPAETGTGLKLATLAMAPAVVAISALGLGMNWAEFRALAGLCGSGILAILSLFARALAGLGVKALSGTAAAGARQKGKLQDRVAARARARDAARTEAREEAAILRASAPAPRNDVADNRDDDRLMARISAAVQARNRREPPLTEPLPGEEGDAPPAPVYEDPRDRAVAAAVAARRAAAARSGPATRGAEEPPLRAPAPAFDDEEDDAPLQVERPDRPERAERTERRIPTLRGRVFEDDEDETAEDEAPLPRLDVDADAAERDRAALRATLALARSRAEPVAAAPVPAEDWSPAPGWDDAEDEDAAPGPRLSARPAARDEAEEESVPLTRRIVKNEPMGIDLALPEDDEDDDGPLMPRSAFDPQEQDAADDRLHAEPPARPVPHKPQAVPGQARPETAPRLAVDEEDDAEPPYDAPPLGLLSNPEHIMRLQLSDEALEQNARMLENVLDDYGIRGEIVSVRPGPVVTMYELEPAPGLKASRVIGLADDIARSMSALAARVSTVPGRSVIGIELPNDEREKVLLREILADKVFGESTHRLPLALGKDIGGEPIVANLARMPHLLIAGTTGSGKSVAINTMILSLLYRLSPKECRLIMIDPKMLELSVYDGIPHLLSPVVTDPKKAVVALKWVVAEMEERYRKMSKMGVRNIEGYNARVADALARGEAFSRVVQTGFDDDTGEAIYENEEFEPEAMPFIVVIVDEMADLMMVAGKEIEACIQRLAQMARASGIHLIMATQRPSVDVITGTIKANFPTRISFQVTSKIDSRTILGEQGAEQLLGMGDMLYMAGGGRISRVHGPFCSDEEVEAVVNHLKSIGAPDYISGVVEGPDEGTESNIDAVLGLGGNTSSEDALYDQAVAIVARDRKCSTSYIQRKLGIGYNKAARLVEQMEDEGVVSGANQVGKRDVLIAER
ncbi:DNA translocase FtsK [Paroceanicella profunda]|uniref:DNA translocase FtsK n=2 Tax=Paroceanicella profunda TaxID=2579971 RepID=A0A5B8G2L0_9RHOB|nr:DNA translocase FtsK 4TM domain-containing protein [Paroceanicella profunda]QDL93599.1 DNA translocase FtsK [Paroceanicella profunda]